MKKEKYMSWDTYFMSIAALSALRSKDPYKQNGACIVNKNNKIIGIGYNGLSIGLDDNNTKFWGGIDDDSMQVNPRHAYSVHAERNAVLNSNQSELEGATIYTTQYPCHICAQEIAQAGIKKIIYILKKPHHKQVNEIVKDIFVGAKIEEISFNELNPKDKSFLEIIEKTKFYN